jgi:quercetin dioxygenase-like cupin family protein
MNDFPEFMQSPKNRISSRSQYSKGIQGYVYDGADGSQMAFWTYEIDGRSQEHVHDYDEYFVVVQGKYTLLIGGKKIPMGPGQEYFIAKGLAHAGEYSAGTRTIHAFGGKRVKREIEE